MVYDPNRLASDGEDFVAGILDKIGEDYKREKKIYGLKGDAISYPRIADFYLPKHKIYIEFFGGWNTPNLEERKTERARYMEKKRVYDLNKIKCIYLYPQSYFKFSGIIKQQIINFNQGIRNDEDLTMLGVESTDIPKKKQVKKHVKPHKNKHIKKRAKSNGYNRKKERTRQKYSNSPRIKNSPTIKTGQYSNSPRIKVGQSTIMVKKDNNHMAGIGLNYLILILLLAVIVILGITFELGPFNNSVQPLDDGKVDIPSVDEVEATTITTIEPPATTTTTFEPPIEDPAYLEDYSPISESPTIGEIYTKIHVGDTWEQVAEQVHSNDKYTWQSNHREYKNLAIYLTDGNLYAQRDSDVDLYFDQEVQDREGWINPSARVITVDLHIGGHLINSK